MDRCYVGSLEEPLVYLRSTVNKTKGGPTMRQTQETLRQENTTSDSVLYIAFELSNSTWKLAFGDGTKTRYATVSARDLEQLEDEIDKAQRHFGLKGAVQVKSCYEAGRDDFWMHR
jgi:transposase